MITAAWKMFIRPMVAWLTSCWIAAAMLFSTYLIIERTPLALSSGSAIFICDFILTTSLLAFFIAALTAIPVIILIQMARRFDWRRGYAEVTVGTFLPFLVMSIFFASQYNTFTESLAGIVDGATFIPAGFAGGLCYWALAGRNRSST